MQTVTSCFISQNQRIITKSIICRKFFDCCSVMTSKSTKESNSIYQLNSDVHCVTYKYLFELSYIQEHFIKRNH
jgi:hypothetical protein